MLFEIITGSIGIVWLISVACLVVIGVWFVGTEIVDNLRYKISMHKAEKAEKRKMMERIAKSLEANQELLELCVDLIEDYKHPVGGNEHE